MSNSLLYILVFGRRPGITAAKLAKEATKHKLSLKHLNTYMAQLEALGIPNKEIPVIPSDCREERVLSRIVN